MDIRPIHTEAEYEAALAEIDRLFDAAPNTPDGDHLEVLATLVEAYESSLQHSRARPHPERSPTTWKVAALPP
jgi:HTH-type transcriptional regulator/antitoxin HigA